MSLRGIGLTLALLVSMPLLADPPRLAVSIPPWHSLAASLTRGVSEVTLLLPAGHSPHEGGLAPSMLKSILNADLVIWTGPQLETGIARALDGTASERVMTIASLPALDRLPLRHYGQIHGHDHDHDHDPGEGGDTGAGIEGPLDPHLWLSPHNAREFANALTARLMVLDPANGATYQANLVQLLSRIDALAIRIRQDLEPVADAPFLVFHDAYQYFESAFGVASVGAVTLGPDRQPGARKLRELRRLIRDRGVGCVFAEPQFEPSLVEVLIEDLGIRAGTLDPLGARLATGPELWFDLMAGLSDGLLDCLREPVQ